MKSFVAIIPARFASTRFPGKPLAILGGKPVIQRVYEQAKKVFENVFVATDDDRIYDAVEQFGGKAIMTSPNHKSGTDRCYEAYQKCGIETDVVVNIQGDEPFIHQSQLLTIKELFLQPETDIATLVKPFASDTSFEVLSNPNSPKVVVDDNWNALYFSRSVIPYLRGKETETWASEHTYYKHIGLYAFKSDVLGKVTSLEQAPLEIAESLEQLRWLSAGYTIKVGKTNVETIGIDTPEDLAAAEKFLMDNKL
ncbi:MAG: 3-deoxy-manno-octulosonate cytidylyltransferase [Bacteroidaceae bacterium]|nr:3-deoxy-manno-octulosonate cytidylyltransferase [Bacteroidaceae bacterium]